MRIAQQENWVEKRGWVAWFTRKTSKTSSQEVCTTYVGHRRPSVLPWERRHWVLPGRILETQGKLVSLAGLRTPDGNSARGWEREWHEETSISRNWSHFLFFQGLSVYTEMLYKSHTGSAVLTFIKVRCFIQMYTEVLGVLHHLLARGPAENLWPSPCNSGQSTRTLISPGVIILKTDATFRRYQIKLHSYRVKV